MDKQVHITETRLMVDDLVIFSLNGITFIWDGSLMPDKNLYICVELQHGNSSTQLLVNNVYSR